MNGHPERTDDHRQDRRRIAVVPQRRALAVAVERGGGVPVTDGPCAGLVWTDPRGPDALRDFLRAHPDTAWVQLPFAGVEPFVDVFDHDRHWTCGKGVYAEPVAEHVLALALAGLRNVGDYARQSSWTAPMGRNLLGANVTVLGGGGITESLLRLLAPWRTVNTVVRRTEAPVPGANRVIRLRDLDRVLAGTDLLVVAVALTPETEGILDERRLRLLPAHAWVVNVGRGRHVVTDDMVRVLAEERIGGYATDVTEPEPLPDGHPLWAERRCIITPHIANTPEMGLPLLAERVTENVRRFIAGDDLIGPVDVDAGY